MSKLNGIFPPIPTPFINDELSLVKLEHNFIKWNTTGLRGYVVMGSNGEGVFLTPEEKLRLTEAAKKFASPDKLIIAGTGSESIKETISLTNRVADIGADYALVLTPSYYKSEMKHDSLIVYFTRVADASKIPVILYNVPKFSGVDLTADTVARLAEHPNIIGIKNSTENIRQLMEFVSATPDDFEVLVGTASILYNGLTSGATGAIVALANVAPRECVQIQTHVKSKNYFEALGLQQKTIPLNKLITTQYGVAGLKAAMDMLGYFGGEPRAPLLPLSDEAKIDLKNVLDRTEIYT